MADKIVAEGSNEVPSETFTKEESNEVTAETCTKEESSQVPSETSTRLYTSADILENFDSLTEEQKSKVIDGMLEAAVRILGPDNPLLQIFAVRVDCEKLEGRAELYGYIKVKDQLGEMTLFERKEDGPAPSKTMLMYRFHALQTAVFLPRVRYIWTWSSMLR